MEGLDRMFDERRDLGKPCSALLTSAARHGCVRPPHNAGDPAKTEDAVLPERFERVTEHRRFSLRRGIGRIEDQGVPGSKKTKWYPFEPNPCRIRIRGVQPKDAIYPALENGWWLTPPVRMEDEDEIGTRKL